MTEIHYNDMVVTDRGITYTMADLGRLHAIYDRLCTAETIYIYSPYDITMEEAYHIADGVRDMIADCCTCESDVLEEIIFDEEKFKKVLDKVRSRVYN